MKHLLVINPNTSTDVSDRLAHHVQAFAGTRARVSVATAGFGAPYIADEASYAVAGHAALDTWARAIAQFGPNVPPPDAVLIGCFGDPGLFALRESSAAPVSGLAEASFLSAIERGRFAIVTGGDRWAAMLRRLALSLGVADHLSTIVTVAPTGAELAADTELARRELGMACQKALDAGPVESIILGGAGLVGLAALIQDSCPVPLLDSVLVSAERAIEGRLPTPVVSLSGFSSPWTGVSPAMASMQR